MGIPRGDLAFFCLSFFFFLRNRYSGTRMRRFLSGPGGAPHYSFSFRPVPLLFITMRQSQTVVAGPFHLEFSRRWRSLFLFFLLIGFLPPLSNGYTLFEASCGKDDAISSFYPFFRDPPLFFSPRMELGSSCRDCYPAEPVRNTLRGPSRLPLPFFFLRGLFPSPTPSSYRERG